MKIIEPVLFPVTYDLLECLKIASENKITNCFFLQNFNFQKIHFDIITKYIEPKMWQFLLDELSSNMAHSIIPNFNLGDAIEIIGDNIYKKYFLFILCDYIEKHAGHFRGYKHFKEYLDGKHDFSYKRNIKPKLISEINGYYNTIIIPRLWRDNDINKNRQKLDVEEPDDSFIWEGISSELDKGKSKRIPWLRLAAVFILLLTAGYIIIYQTLKQDEKLEYLSLSDISEDLAQQENIYQLTINQQMDHIQSMEVDPEKYKTFFEEIDVLDQYYDEYLKDLQEVGNKPKLIQAMLHYYELKIRILERMLSEIEKTKYNENKNKRL